MWLIESEDETFNNKRLWLRPGGRFLFGRTRTEAGQYAISNKTISRQHLTVEIDVVKAGDGTNVESRSQVTLEDLKTKIGTQVDGVQIRGTRHVLTGTHHEIKLGHHEKLFRITWVPVVLTFSYTSKEIRGGALTETLQRLEPLDIKCAVEYIHGKTTHLVTKKRNTAKGLQALIDGKCIVTEAFVDVIENATRRDDKEPDTLSKLELDFDLNWPNALHFLPPRGKEPTDKPETAYAPDPARQNIFDGYTFVFYESAQFEQLLAPITNGKGKALIHQVQAHQTTVEEFVLYVKNVAGEKGLGEFEDGSEGKGVVVVRYVPAVGDVEWYTKFVVDVSQFLDHRLIEQREFLDAILSNDASPLRKALEPETSDNMAPPPSEMAAPPSHQAPISHDTELPTNSVPAPARKGRARRVVTSRFKGFDDSPDPEPLPLATPLPEIVEETPQSQELGMFISQRDEMEMDVGQSVSTAAEPRTSRKRPSPPNEEEEEEDVMEALAPTASRFKKQKLAQDAERRRRGEPTPPPVIVEKQPKAEAKPKKIKKEIDILEVARQQREKAEEMARAERESLQESFEGMDIDSIRNLAIIEEMEIRRPDPPPQRRANVTGDESERWDERWNGRKNFKKFRRQGTTDGPRRPVEKVIVALEEVKKKDFGIGDQYWLEKGKGSQSKGKEKETLTSQSDSAPPPSGRRGRVEHIILDDDDDEDEDLEDEDADLPTKPSVSSRSQQKTPASSKSQASSRATVSQAKRPAATNLEKAGAAKKPKQTTLGRRAPVDDDSSEEDELRFRFKRK